MSDPASHRLFSYGTLRLAEVQSSLFGRLVPSAPDALVGWRVEQVEIGDPAVIAVSGLSRHPALVRSGDPADRIEGSVLTLADADVAAVDAYEAAAYVRTTTFTEAGLEVEVYVLARRGLKANKRA